MRPTPTNIVEIKVTRQLVNYEKGVNVVILPWEPTLRQYHLPYLSEMFWCILDKIVWKNYSIIDVSVSKLLFKVVINLFCQSKPNIWIQTSGLCYTNADCHYANNAVKTKVGRLNDIIGMDPVQSCCQGDSNLSRTNDPPIWHQCWFI